MPWIVVIGGVALVLAIMTGTSGAVPSGWKEPPKKNQ
jgi:hypothetical protein